MRRRGEAGQDVGEDRGGLSLLASPENLCPWLPAQTQTLWCGISWGT